MIMAIKHLSRVFLLAIPLLFISGCSKESEQRSGKDSKKDYATVRGNIRDGNEKPIPGVLVTLYFGTSMLTEYTNDKGNFLFEKVLDGDYRMVCSKQGYYPREVKFTVKNGIGLIADITLGET